MNRARRFFSLIALVVLFRVFFAFTACALGAEQKIEAPSARGKIIEEGQTYVLISSHREEGVETEEYGLEGQTASDWTELITYQRLMLSEALNADEYVDALKRRIESENSTAHFRIIQKTPKAALFGVEYISPTPADAQLAFVLVTATGGSRSHELHLIQYAVQPSRMPLEKLQLNVKRWQARFQSQVILSRSETNGVSLR